MTTFTGSYNDNKSKFNTAANGGVMPWWSDIQKSVEFTSALGAELGYPNKFRYGAFDLIFGPAFGYGFQDSNIANNQFYVQAILFNKPTSDVVQFPYFEKTNNNVTWAYATPVPGPLPILSFAAAFGYSRKLRKRIKSSKPEVISTTAV